MSAQNVRSPPDDCILTETVTATDYGSSRSVCVSVTTACREILDIGRTDEIRVAVHRDRVELHPDCSRTHDEALSNVDRQLHRRGRTVAVNIPALAVQVLDIEQGQLLSSTLREDCIEIRPIDGVTA